MKEKFAHGRDIRSGLVEALKKAPTATPHDPNDIHDRRGDPGISPEALGEKFWERFQQPAPPSDDDHRDG